MMIELTKEEGKLINQLLKRAKRLGELHLDVLDVVESIENKIEYCLYDIHEYEKFNR